VDVQLITTQLNIQVHTITSRLNLPQNIPGLTNSEIFSHNDSFLESQIHHDMTYGYSAIEDLLDHGRDRVTNTGSISNFHTDLYKIIGNDHRTDVFNRLDDNVAGRRLQATDNSTDSGSSSSNSTVPVTVKVVESVPGYDWRASGEALQPQALGLLQQLLADSTRLGVTAVLPGFVSSLERYHSQFYQLL
jgi:hypothetical protein